MTIISFAAVAVVVVEVFVILGVDVTLAVVVNNVVDVIVVFW